MNKQPTFAKHVGPQRYRNTDPNPQVPFCDEFPPMQPWEFVAWSMIVGIVLGFIVFGGYFGYPW